MSKLVFSGKVTTGDEFRVAHCDHDDKHPDDCDQKHGALWIGDRDIVSEVGEVEWSGPVTCAIYSGVLTGDTAFQGALRIQEGWGYSEYTPVDSDELFVGNHDLLKIIGELEDTEVTVWFANEPINVLEGVTAQLRETGGP